MSERCCDFRWKDRNNAAVNCMLQFLGTCSDGLLMCRMSLIKLYILQGLNWRLSSSPCMTNTMLSLTEARQITLEAQTVSGKRWDCGFTQTGLSQLDAFVSFSLEESKVAQHRRRWCNTRSSPQVSVASERADRYFSVCHHVNKNPCLIWLPSNEPSHVAGFLANYGCGMSWWQALVLPPLTPLPVRSSPLPICMHTSI